MTDRPTDRPTNQPRDRQTGSIIECKNDKYLGENKIRRRKQEAKGREGNGKRERTTEKKEEVWLGGGGKTERTQKVMRSRG